MALNPSYEAIGKGFVSQYYALFDDPNQRPNLINLYSAESSFMTFEGQQIQGGLKIMEKLNSLGFQKIERAVTSVDSQPMFDGGVLISVFGRLRSLIECYIYNYIKISMIILMVGQTDDDHPHAYVQTFVLSPIGTSFFVQHDIFRLGMIYQLTDDDPPHMYFQTFVLKPLANSFFCQHDIFRLGIHDKL
ncbi:GSCOCG00000647001-RA-CDS [Cotesia congregata]|nr:GSCOCG00000647001-RA-CDS [Cotesia congregata]